jgi:beta-lactamase class D
MSGFLLILPAFSHFRPRMNGIWQKECVIMARPGNTFLRLLLPLVAAAGWTLATHANAAPDVVECTVVLDQNTGKAIIRTGTCDKRVTPMSTFKVPLALIGYDAGILKDRNNPRWQYDPKFDAPKRTHKTVDPVIWEEESILWYSQELTRKLGKTSFDAYVGKLGYGNRDTGGRPGSDDGLTQSWLSSSLLISPDEQAEFMRRIAARDLPVSPSAIEKTVDIVPAFKAGAGWNVQGKTGSGWLRRANGKLDRARPVGWFVGWAENGGRKIAFARMRIDIERASEPAGPKLRAGFLAELPALMRNR